MSFFDSIFNKAPVQQPAPTPAAPVPTQQDGAFGKSTTPDPVPAPTAVLDAHKDLFVPTPLKEGEAPKGPTDYISYNPDTFAKQVENINFLSGEGMDVLAANAAKGDPTALLQLVNKAVQSGYEQGARLTATASNAATRAGVADAVNQVPQQFRSNQASAELQKLNPALSHAAVAPMVSQVQTAFEAKNPTASGAQIAEMVNNFFTGLAKATTPNQDPSKTDTGLQPNQDFSTYFNSSGRG